MTDLKMCREGHLIPRDILSCRFCRRNETKRRARAINAQHVVFVYGTLKKGYNNHRLLELGKAQFLGEDEAPGVVYGPFPFAKPEEGWIKGETYKVDGVTLGRLDALEGHPWAYERTSVVLKSGVKAGIYYYKRELGRDAAPCPDGRWTDGRLRERRSA